MLDFDFDQEIDRRNTGSLKWGKYAGTDVVPMWVADMDFASPPAVVDAVQQRVAHAVFGYSRPHSGVIDATLAYLQRAHGVEVDPSWIVWLPGCVPALSMACGATGEPGASVMTNSPVYPPFLHVHRDSGRQLINVPLACDAATNSGYTFDFDAMEAAVTPDTRVFLLCNPHNPAGRVFNAAELEALIDFCQRHQLILCSDEIHCDLVFDDAGASHRTAIGFPDAIRDRTITLLAASKTYNVAGLACAYAVIPDASLRRKFVAAGGKLIPEISPLSFHATEASYRHGEPWRQALLAYLKTNRDALSTFVAGKLAPIKMAPMEATYLAWLDVRELGLENPGTHFEKHGVGLSNGGDFGAPGFLRVNFGCTRKTLEEGMKRMASAVESIR
ncbi:MAG: cystathionine beta-lyase [Verrucomicrobiales bacterium]|jgi:cystathionine beta-lyase